MKVKETKTNKINLMRGKIEEDNGTIVTKRKKRGERTCLRNGMNIEKNLKPSSACLSV
jgi:hypothetical protein